MISKRHNCIFVHIPKCGGSSLESLIWSAAERTPENLCKGMINGYYNPYQTGGLQHLKALQIRQHVGDDVFDRSFKFAIIRNPFDKAVSQYLYMAKRKDLRNFIGMSEDDDFLSYLKKTQRRSHIQWEAQVSFLYDFRGRQLVDYVGRFEKLELAMAEISQRIGLDLGAPIPHLNRSLARGEYQNYYCEESKRMVEDFYRDDLEVFEYGFED
jgi:hypothetical protein